MSFLRIIGILFIAACLLVAVFLFSARLHDGPISGFAGGPLESGEWAASQGTNFSYAEDLPTIELQLIHPPRSRTVWVIYHDGDLYVPCGFIDLPIWKQWPHEAMADGRAVARIEGKRYPFDLQRVEDPATWSEVVALVADKYNLPADPSDIDRMKNLWIFKLNPQAG